MNRQVFIQNTGSLAVNGVSDPTALASGQIGAFDVATGDEVALWESDGAGGSNATPAPEAFQLFIGGEPLLSSGIIRKEDVRATKAVYSAPQKQRAVISSTSVEVGEGEGAVLKVVDTTEGYKPFIRFSSSVRVKEDMAVGDLRQQLVDQINNNARATVTASISGSDIVLEANEVGTIFEVAFEGIGPNATATITQRPERGTGTPEQVRDIEISAKGFYSQYYVENGLLGELEGLPSFVDYDEEYTLYLIQVRTNTPDNMGLTAHKWREIAVALGSDVTGNLDSFLGL